MLITEVILFIHWANEYKLNNSTDNLFKINMHYNKKADSYQFRFKYKELSNIPANFTYENYPQH